MQIVPRIASGTNYCNQLVGAVVDVDWGGSACVRVCAWVCVCKALHICTYEVSCLHSLTCTSFTLCGSWMVALQSKKITTITFNPFFPENWSEAKQTFAENAAEIISNESPLFSFLALLPFFCSDESRFVLHFSWPELNEGWKTRFTFNEVFQPFKILPSPLARLQIPALWKNKTG